MHYAPKPQKRYFVETEIIDDIEQAQARKEKLGQQCIEEEAHIRNLRDDIDSNPQKTDNEFNEYLRAKSELECAERRLLKMSRAISRLERKRLPELKETLAAFRTKTFEFMPDQSTILCK